MLVLKTVTYKSKLLDFQYFASLIFDILYTPLVKKGYFLRNTNLQITIQCYLANKRTQYIELLNIT